jgi:hypothetical protein
MCVMKLKLIFSTSQNILKRLGSSEERCDAEAKMAARILLQLAADDHNVSSL